jgi:hypothetical protein
MSPFTAAAAHDANLFLLLRILHLAAAAAAAIEHLKTPSGCAQQS